MRKVIFLVFVCCAAVSASGQTFHRIGVDLRPVYVIPTLGFLAGDNRHGTPIERSVSLHLKYGFQNPRRTHAPTAWQGVGVSYHRFLYNPAPDYGYSWPSNVENPHELGNPTAVYLFQGARIARLGPRLSLDYEWNFGLSLGWVPYDYFANEFNKVIGSKVNAYLNADFILTYRLSRSMDLTGGVSLSHFSNGNTQLPNAGLNTAGLTLGAVYHFDRPDGLDPRSRVEPPFRRHVSYEALLFGAWRKKGVKVGDDIYASPHTYAVAGFSAAAMVNLGRKVRVGTSIDGVYDGSANTYFLDSQSGMNDENFVAPSWREQWALGLAVQTDYVMPYFTLTLGFGANVLHGGGELRSFYQKLALKIDLTPGTFLHIGYSLLEFRAPRFLMLGVGMRFGHGHRPSY